MRHKPKQHLLALILVGLVLSSGCKGAKDIKVGTSIRWDGSGKRIITMTLDRQTVAEIERQNKTELVRLIKKMSPPHTAVNKSQKNNHIDLTVTIPFDNVKDIPAQSSRLLKRTQGNTISLAKEDRIFAVGYDLKERLRFDGDLFDKLVPDTADPDPSTLEIEYWTKIPGEIRETSGTPITADKAVWKIEPGKTHKIRTKSLLIRWWVVALSGIGVLFLIGLAGATVINLRSRSEQAG